MSYKRKKDLTEKIDVLYAKKYLRHCIRYLLPFTITSGYLVSGTAFADDYFFDPALLETAKSGQRPVDLSLFSHKNAQQPGEYSVDIYINNKKLMQRTLPFVIANNHQLQPQFTVGQLRELGFKVDENPAFANADDGTRIPDLAKAVPGSVAIFDFNHSKLKLSVPQIALYRDARGYVDPSRWDNGVPVVFTNYSFTGSRSRYDNNEQSERQYMNLQSGANFGEWRLRNYSTWTHNEDDARWDSINSWLQRDIKSLRSQLVIGESSTDGAIFPGYQFTGARLYSDDNMLPNSQKGFAPTIRGIANSSAIVTVRQNGYTIYQSNVPAGAFEINDLYPSSFGGDLDVSIEEADGTVRHFVQPFSSLPVMQRLGHLKYSLTAGRFRAAQSAESKEPQFIESTGIYGLSNALTVYGGMLTAENYRSQTVGVGGTLGEFGAVSVDIGRAETQFDDGNTFEGYTWRTQYIKDLPETDTNLSLGYYRYTSNGYFTFSDANAKNINNSYRQKSEAQFSISQTLLKSINFYVSGSQRTYWNDSQKDNNFSAGLNGSLYGVSYNLNGQFTDSTDRESERSVSLSISVPLDRWLPHAQATWRVTEDKNKATQHEIGINGSLLDDYRLSYSLKQRQSEDNDNTSSSFSANYRSAYGTVSSSYDYSPDNRQLSYGLSGGVVAHSHGVTLSQPLGNAFALIDANGAANIRIKNYPGIATDYFGNAVIPFLTPYQENRITLDTTTMPDDVDVTETAKIVVPGQGAAVSAYFSAQTGRRVLLTVTDAQNTPLPFGAMANNQSAGMQSIVDEGGVLYLTGVNELPQTWTIRWGKEASQQCQFTYSLSENRQSASSVLKDTTVCR